MSGSEYEPGGIDLEEGMKIGEIIQDKIDILQVSAGMVSAQRSGTSSLPSPTDPSTWISFTMRIADDAAPAAYYDIQSQQGAKYAREPSGWFLEASVDGREWVEADARAGVSAAASGSRW